MDGGARQFYVPPVVHDYGTLHEMTADGGMLAHVGIAPMAQTSLSGPLGSQSGGSNSVLGTQGTGSTGNPDAGGTAGTHAGGSGGGGVGGAAGGGGGGLGGGGAGGGGKLPFTGLPLALLVSAGAGLAAAGAAVRRFVTRDEL